MLTVIIIGIVQVLLVFLPSKSFAKQTLIFWEKLMLDMWSVSYCPWMFNFKLCFRSSYNASGDYAYCQVPLKCRCTKSKSRQKFDFPFSFFSVTRSSKHNWRITKPKRPSFKTTRQNKISKKCPCSSVRQYNWCTLHHRTCGIFTLLILKQYPMHSWWKALIVLYPIIVLKPRIVLKSMIVLAMLNCVHSLEDYTRKQYCIWYQHVQHAIQILQRAH